MSKLPHILATALVGSGLAVLAGVTMNDSGATTPGPNGRIVYAQEAQGHFQLFTVRSDGTGRVPSALMISTEQNGGPPLSG
jgi:hypothetical protein